MKVLIACEYSGIVRDAFIAQGHDAISCDLLPTESEGPHFQGDVFKLLGETYNLAEDGGTVKMKRHDFDLMIAHPPCTHISVSGARWFPPHTQPDEAGFKPLHLRFEALAFVDRLMGLDIPRICIENPLSVISGFIRKSDQTIQPWQYGHLESKRTCLWLKGLPRLKSTEVVYDEMMELPIKIRDRIHWLGSGKGKERSKFYTGIAEAMATQWGDES